MGSDSNCFGVEVTLEPPAMGTHFSGLSLKKWSPGRAALSDVSAKAGTVFEKSFSAIWATNQATSACEHGGSARVANVAACGGERRSSPPWSASRRELIGI